MQVPGRFDQALNGFAGRIVVFDPMVRMILTSARVSGCASFKSLPRGRKVYPTQQRHGARPRPRRWAARAGLGVAASCREGSSILRGKSSRLAPGIAQ